MNIFRQLRWKLTLNYTIVTVSAFLAVILVLGAIYIPRIFVQSTLVDPEGLLRLLQKNENPLWGHVLSRSPVDTELIRLLLRETDPQITSFDLVRIGSVQFTVRTMAAFRVLVIGADGTLLGKSSDGFPDDYIVGQYFDLTREQGLEAPYNAALAGGADASQLYTIFQSTGKFVLVIPIFRPGDGDGNQVAGVLVVFVDNFPNQAVVPSHILNIAARSLLIFLIGIGILGAIFGSFYAHGLSVRFRRLSTIIDAWSEGDFSGFIEDATGDEISQFARRLNNMAKQLQGLLRRRQEMAVSEERNRLARDLHDSAKQMALAASFQQGAALELFDRDPKTAHKHFVEADALIDSVRNELTNLVDELRLQPTDGQDFANNLKDYVMDWSHRSGVDLRIDIEGNQVLSVETRESLFRIAQEALANITRHSSARHVDVSLKYTPGVVEMIIKDDGHGFDKKVQHSGFGLYSMRERAETLGGRFTIESTPGQGTEITVTLPWLVI